MSQLASAAIWHEKTGHPAAFGTRLPAPGRSWRDAEDWVEAHLDDLCGDQTRASLGFRGGQTAAIEALSAFDVAGYASRRNQVWPRSARGASYLSPYIRHGLLTLPQVWNQVTGGPARDVGRFRDELLWQEYARHLYARLGTRLGDSLRASQPQFRDLGEGGVWTRDMLCLARVMDDLEDFGWAPNQARMWLASHWAVRHEGRWQEGEDRLYRELLDGSRAANRLGWQWTAGTGTGRPYAFTRRQVEKRAPGLCRRCELADTCPIQQRPAPRALAPRAPVAELLSDQAPERTAGPEAAVHRGRPERVWLTAESLGMDDPAMAAHPELPAVFVFDAPLLAKLRLSRRRLVFLAETLAELATQRPLEIHRGSPAAILSAWPLAATFTPVPGWRRLSARLDLAEIHPWPWLRRPHAGPIHSFSAWRKALGGAR